MPESRKASKKRKAGDARRQSECRERKRVRAAMAEAEVHVWKAIKDGRVRDGRVEVLVEWKAANDVVRVRELVTPDVGRMRKQIY